MKLEKRIKQSDSYEDWEKIYLDGGEKLLREFSEKVHTPERGLGKTLEESFSRRLIVAVSSCATSSEEILNVVDRVPENYKYYLIENKHCPPWLIEELFIGKYYDGVGVPDFDVGARRAYSHHHDIALDIFCRRPDLHQFMSSSLVSMYQWALKRKWNLPLPKCTDQETLKLIRFAETGVYEE